MSFSKARIQRFNELGSDAPPPGAYDPKFIDKVKGSVIEKTDRFLENKSVTSADLSNSCKSLSTQPPVIFRTPQLGRKKLIIKSSTPKVKTQKLQYDSEHQVADLQVECCNKDKTIQEYEKLMEDTKAEVLKLQKQIDELLQKQVEVDEQHRNDTETLAKLQQEILNSHDEKHQAEIESLRCQLLEVSEERERESEARKSTETELRSRIANFSKRVAALEIELKEKCETSKKQIIDMIDLQRKTEGEMREMKANFEKEKETYIVAADTEVKELKEANAFLEKELADVQRLYKDLSNRLAEAHKELEDADKRHNLLLDKHKQDLEKLQKLHDEEKTRLNQLLEKARQEYLQGIEDLTLARDKEIAELKESSEKQKEEEIKRLKEHADKMVKNAETVTRKTLAACRAESKERIKRVIAESDAKVNAMIRNARNVVEEELRLTAESYKTCIAQMEVERAALEEKLEQRDAEITKLSLALEELKSSAETMESFGQSLQMELDRAETKLAVKKQELKSLRIQMRTEAAKMVNRKKRFELIIAENQASVAALTNNLTHSNAEVKRLQLEVKRGLDSIDEHRDLLNILRNNSQMVQEQLQAIVGENDAKKELVKQLETDSLAELESMKCLAKAKIDNFKIIAGQEIDKCRQEREEMAAQHAEMKKQLREMSDRLAEAQKMLLKLEETNDTQALENSRVQLLNKKLEEELKSTTTLLSEKMTEDNSLHLAKIISDYEIMRKEWTTQLEKEKTRREAAEESLAEISKKYAEIVGHQNLKQKIKHVSQLKDKLCQQEQELKEKSRIIEQQQKTIEKFKTEEKCLHSNGKENKIKLSKTSTPVSSPHKPLTPLRSRND